MKFEDILLKYVVADIVDQLQHDIEVDYTRIGSKQAYIGDKVAVYAGGEEWAVYPFKSYWTVVGFVCNGVFVEYGKYSRTTSKQITQFCNKYELSRVYIER